MCRLTSDWANKVPQAKFVEINNDSRPLTTRDTVLPKQEHYAEEDNKGSNRRNSVTRTKTKELVKAFIIVCIILIIIAAAMSTFVIINGKTNKQEDKTGAPNRQTLS
ncbi:unnamed protein product, partial [Didymodactylos carnosus]